MPKTPTDTLATLAAIELLYNHVDETTATDRWFALSGMAKDIRISAAYHLRQQLRSALTGGK